ncbi:hypothetical protein DITRI_Ditri15bG0079100 [Diplodiscus trichospermus]
MALINIILASKRRRRRGTGSSFSATRLIRSSASPSLSSSSQLNSLISRILSQLGGKLHCMDNSTCSSGKALLEIEMNDEVRSI